MRAPKVVVSAVVAAIVAVFAGVSSARPTAGDVIHAMPGTVSYEADGAEQVQTETYDLGAEAFHVSEFDRAGRASGSRLPSENGRGQAPVVGGVRTQDAPDM